MMRGLRDAQPLYTWVMSGLTAGEEAALSQVLELAGDCDRGVAIGVLSSVDWDVQVR